ncbi:zinc finger MYM-type protein 4-like isoform X2 [Phyllopteryx taeniolatus]|uniref:zinc finger MYM-type protein 4-like isoform X2 n=1 Tax=Phyllopteryx taeniolatus TaxID=161469 RepID=UPI002AD2CB02|nr:zinc finger MYM-type protein 4-like isoform X2 [Phyllopteryx taeniolatus]
MPATRKCVFPGCHSFQNSSVSFFRFPKNEEMKKRWIDFIKSHVDGELKIHNNIRLCSDHFTKDSFVNFYRRQQGFMAKLLLVNGAEPTVSLPGLHPPVPLSSGAMVGSHIMPPPKSHEQQQSRVFDQVMGLGDFADSSQGSNTSSKSGGLEETKAVDEISGQDEQQQPEEDSSNSSSRQEEKMGERSEEPSTRIASLVTEQCSSFTMGPSEGGGGSGEAAFDDALDGLPSFGPEEEDDEDWHFALPPETLQDVDCEKVKCKNNQSRKELIKIQEGPSPLEPREEVEEEREREATSGSANTSHSSKDNTPESSQDARIVNQTEETEDGQQGESDPPPVEVSNPPMSPNITVKDEPIDEGYDAALLPQGNVRQIKEELDHQEEELRISSVYSVGGGNTLVSPVAHQVATVSQQTAIFIPGRGAVLQAMAPLSVRPPAPIQTSLPSLPPIALRPPAPTIPGSVRCSGCFKVLLKGQTAFQRKGSTQLFCSTLCLTGHLPPANKNQLCSLCNSEILRARDTITIPADDNTYLHFCGQHCLSIFRHRTKKPEKAPEKVVDKRPEKKIEKPQEKPAERPAENVICSVCRITNRIEHEVSHQGRLHRLCSDACFVTWRRMRQLAMNCCESCGLYCNSSSDSYHTLTIEKSELNFCGPTCIGTYKQSCRKTIECARCQKSAIVSSTIMERDEKGKVQLYCSPVCVQMSRPPLHTLTGAAFPCCLCKTVAVPQYHLAMVDGTIRNFCSYECVSTFRKTGHTGSDLINGKSSPRDASRLGPSSGASSVPPIPQDYPSSAPYPSHHGSNSSVPPLVPPSLGLTSTSAPGQGHPRTPLAQPLKQGEGGASDSPKVTCHQCTKQFITKPLLFGHRDRISVFCSMTCCDLYKTQNNIHVMCEVCRRDKVPFDTIHYNGKDIFFCSKYCKQNFKMCITSRNKDPPCRPCSYCYSISQKMLHSHYGGKLEEFCKPLCMSQYTVLYYGMGRCDSCRKQGYLNEKLQYMGSVRNFCNLTCLLGYCSVNFESSQHTTSNGTGAEPPHAPAQPHHSSKANPVIADVVSLANGSATQPSVPSDIAMTGGLPNCSVDGKILDHASTQTDAMRGPPSNRRQMKNKSVLCRPFTMDQESLCLLLSPSTDSSDDITSIDCEKAVKKMKTDQETAPSPPLANCSLEEDKVKVLMVPVPVPVFIPVPMNMYSQHTPVPIAMPITLPVPIVIPPQSKEVTDAAIQSDPWNEETKKQGNVEVSIEQEVTPLVPLPVDPQRKNLKDAAIQSEPLELETEEKNNAEVVSQIKDVRDIAVQSDPVDTAQVPLLITPPQSKDVKDAAVQSETLDLEKRNDLDDFKEYHVTAKVPVPIFVPPLSKHAIGAAVQSDALDLEPAATVQADALDLETAANVQSDSLDVETDTYIQADHLDVEPDANVQSDCLDVEPNANVQSDRLDVATDANVQSDRLDVQPDANVQSDHLDVETDANVQSDRLAVETAATVQSDPLDVETAAPVLSDLRDVETETMMDLDDASTGQDKSKMSEVVTPTIHKVEESPNTPQTKIPPPITSKRKTKAGRSSRKSQAKAKPTTSDQQGNVVAEQQPPSSPMTDLEHDFPMELFDLKPSTPQRGVKRPREGFSGRKRGRRRTGSLDHSVLVTPVTFKLNYMYGVKAWKSWVQQHNTRSRRSNPVVVKEDILQCDSAELSYALSCFIKEVRRPNGDAYSPDSIFYLCLGIQQYLFMKARIENIFTDELYSQFAMEISGMLRLWKPKQLPSGSPVSSRVEESFLWECKQLGAYSPIVLLNTLLFFYTKNFHFTTLAQHQSLSFSNFSLHTKPCTRAGKVLYLRYQRSGAATSSRGETERMKKRQEKEDGDMEMAENVTNPLHCPVRLYEFYLSRCPPTTLKRTDMFYLQPERNVHTHSSYWYTSHTLHHTILQSMLTRILAVKEVQR